jgi:hypothetical protein
MPIRYYPLGGTRRLRETVFAGSHDASITEGSSYAQTQDLEIDGQADAGVRLFDLRIVARDMGDSVKLVGYHGSPGGKEKGVKTTNPFNVRKDHTLETHSKISGEFGLGLRKMLKQAKAFVKGTNEFLIFKFDKCTNYPVIAEYCVEILGDSIYTPIGKEFSKLTLDDLKKKVVCVFNHKELGNMGGYTAADGILGFKSLKGEKGSIGTYDPTFPGLQYFGKGGTAPWKVYQTNKMKLSDNEGIQKKMLMTMGRVEDDYAANVLGMMYWTSTGSVSSIRDRNEEVMWGPTGVRHMGELWRQGLEKSIETQMERDKIRTMTHGGVKRMKAYFPNIIMVDFAEETKKGQTIFDLNAVADEGSSL